MNKKQFLQKDSKQVTAEYRATWTCLSRIEESLMKGDIKEAKLTVCDLLNSLRELDKYHQEKIAQDRLENLLAELRSHGIHIAVMVGKL